MAAEVEMDRENVVHRKGYERFIGLMRWGAIISFLAGIIILFVIAK